MGDILGGVIGGLVASLVALLGWIGKRQADKRRSTRLLVPELEANWDALDSAAAFSVPIAPGEVVTAVYTERQSELADLLSETEWRLVSNAYAATGIARDFCAEDRAWDDLVVTKAYIESAREAVGAALEAFGVPVRATFHRRMEELATEIDRQMIESARAATKATKVLNEVHETVAAQLDAQPPELKALRESIQESLRAGFPVNSIASKLRQELEGHMPEKQLATIEDVILLESKRLRIMGRQENRS